MAQSDTTIRRTSPGPGQLEVTADQSTITLLPGTQHHLNLVLRNTSGTPLTVDLGVAGPPSQWLSLTQSSVFLSASQSARVTLTLTATSDAPSGSYPLTVTAQSRDDASVRVQLDLVFEIAEPGQITVELAPTQAEGQASAEFQVRLSQSGSTPLHINLSASGDQTACNFTFNPATIPVAPFETAISRLTVTARQPLEGVDTRTYPFDVMATTAEGATAMSQAHGQFVQRRLPALDLALRPTRQSGAGPVSFVVHIANPSQIVMNMRLSATDSEGSCQFQFEPPSLVLPAAGSADANLTVTPLQYHSDSVDKTHHLTIRAVSEQGLVSPLQADATFVQTAIEQPVLSMNPSSQSASGPKAFMLQVSNPRAMPMQVELVTSSVDGMCQLAVNPTRMSVPPHGRAVAQLSVRPISKLLQGESRRTCAFMVEVRATDLADPVQVEGSLVQVPGAPIARWLVMAGAAILALLACGGLLWFGSSALRTLGDQVPQISGIIPTPLPLVTPLPVPTDTPTPPVPAQAPVNPPTDNQMPGGNQNPGGGGGGGGKPPPNMAATQTAAAQKAQAAATQTAAAQLTAAAEKTAQALRFSQYNGNWVNDDPNTSGITRLQASNNGSTISVHAFGKCSPNDCDWGTKSGTFKNEPFTILFDFGGGLKHQLTLSKQGNGLKVVDVGSSSGTNTYTFHNSLFLPPIIFFTPTPVLPKINIPLKPFLNQP